MTRIGLIRHGPTGWNRNKIVQGSTDIPLDGLGRKEVSKWELPDGLAEYEWIASPLSRALETAQIITGRKPRTDSRLSEMSWGEWEGRNLNDLRNELGDLLAAWEAKGLDFKGPSGESPREVQERVIPLLAEIAVARVNTVAVCHKGVIRAIYALATNWTMIDKPPDKLRDGCIHFFQLKNDGSPSILELNVEMTGK